MNGNRKIFFLHDLLLRFERIVRNYHMHDRHGAEISEPIFLYYLHSCLVRAMHEQNAVWLKDFSWTEEEE